MSNKPVKMEPTLDDWTKKTIINLILEQIRLMEEAINDEKEDLLEQALVEGHLEQSDVNQYRNAVKNYHHSIECYNSVIRKIQQWRFTNA